MSNGFSPLREPNDNADPSSHVASLEQLADRAEKRLTEHLREEYDREPTAEEVEWARGFPRRMAGGRRRHQPRPPTITEMRNEFNWGPSKSEKERYGEDFIEQHYRRGPNVSHR
jgi:hypothetical protein